MIQRRIEFFAILALAFWSNAVAGENFELVILHTNDVHARIEEITKYGGVCSAEDAANNKCYGGVARIKSAVEAQRSNHSNVLLLDGGDQFQGTVWFNYYKGLAAAHFMNMIGYDAMALGNHEFDNGVSGLIPFLQNITFKALSCNLDSSKEPSLQDLYLKRTTIDVGGETIGIIGFILKETALLVDPAGIENISFEDEITALQREVDYFKNVPVDKIICVGHAGFDLDKLVAERVDGVDVVVGGHTNTFLYTGETPPSNDDPEGPYPIVVTQASGKRVPVVQAFAFGKYLGKLVLVFDESGEVISYSGNPILLDSSITPDPVVAQEVSEWAVPLNEFRQEYVGETLVELMADTDVCRTRECNLGSFFLDGVVHEHLKTGNPTLEQWTKSSIGLWNGGGIRSPVHKGAITREHTLTVFPFANEVYRVTLPGTGLLGMIEHSVHNFDFTGEAPFGGFLQMSGARVTYNLSQPSGERVHSLEVLCSNCLVPVYEKVDLAANYSILTNSFMVNGGDGYSIIRETMLEGEPIGTVSSDVFERYIRHSTPVTASVEGRILFTPNYTAPQPPGDCAEISRGAEGPRVYWTVVSVLTVFIGSCIYE